MGSRILLPAAYAALIIGALLYLFAHAAESPMAGVWVILLTIPWSAVGILATAVLAPGVLENSVVPGVAIVVVGALLNGALLFVVGGRHDRVRGQA